MKSLRIHADLVLNNGVVYTADGEGRKAEAVAVSKDRIVCVGSDHEMKPFIGSNTEVIDLAGRTVLPGFHDAHLHPVLGGLDFNGCSLAGIETLESCLDTIRTYARSHPELPVIRGSGWIHDGFPPQGPDRIHLDRIVPDRPVMLKAVDGHSLWVNSMVLEAAGITGSTPDPPGGLIERYAASMEPSGTLREWSAMKLAEDLYPPATLQERTAGMRLFMEEAGRLGIVAVHDAMVDEDILETYAALHRSGRLLLRTSASILCEPGMDSREFSRLVQMSREFHHRLLKPRSVKIFLDGVIEGHTAFLIRPYADRPNFRGEPLWAEDEFRRTVEKLDRQGFQVHIHAIGDGAVRMALDGFEHAASVNGLRDSRHQIVHLDLCHPDDIPRFRKLGVVANFQPAWFYEEDHSEAVTLRMLGKARYAQLYRIRSFLESGAVVACGSDWPFSGRFATFNPLTAIRTGVTRLAVEGGSRKVFIPEERVDLEDMIVCHTRNCAYASFDEKVSGSIETGKQADLVVLDRNLLESDPLEIHETRILLTLFEGKTLFRDPAL